MKLFAIRAPLFIVRGGDLMSNPNIASRFDEMYNSTSKAVLAFITAKCGRTADISDIFQDTYLELYQVLDKRGANYVTNDKALVLRIAKRKIAKHYSLLERLRIYVSMNTAHKDEEETELADFAADTFLTEDFAVNQVLLETAKQFIQSKPEDVQKVFYLMYDVDLSIPEIAQALSMGESNVKNKLYRTLKELRNLLK
jgi:RNA polymerase sigma-70 factor (ECF subfamily)